MRLIVLIFLALIVSGCVAVTPPQSRTPVSGIQRVAVTIPTAGAHTTCQPHSQGERTTATLAEAGVRGIAQWSNEAQPLLFGREVPRLNGLCWNESREITITNLWRENIENLSQAISPSRSRVSHGIRVAIHGIDNNALFTDWVWRRGPTPATSMFVNMSAWLELSCPGGNQERTLNRSGGDGEPIRARFTYGCVDNQGRPSVNIYEVGTNALVGLYRRNDDGTSNLFVVTARNQEGLLQRDYGLRESIRRALLELLGQTTSPVS